MDYYIADKSMGIKSLIPNLHVNRQGPSCHLMVFIISIFQNLNDLKTNWHQGQWGDVHSNFALNIAETFARPIIFLDIP